MHLFMAGAIVQGKRGQKKRVKKGSSMELINTGNDLFDPISEQKPLDYSTLYLTRKVIEDRPTAAGFAWFPRGKAAIADAEREARALESEETAREGPL
jgi:hypothetical protein